jgi:hypothetical protein
MEIIFLRKIIFSYLTNDMLQKTMQKYSKKFNLCQSFKNLAKHKRKITQNSIFNKVKKIINLNFERKVSI